MPVIRRTVGEDLHSMNMLIGKIPSIYGGGDTILRNECKWRYYV